MQGQDQTASDLQLTVSENNLSSCSPVLFSPSPILSKIIVITLGIGFGTATSHDALNHDAVIAESNQIPDVRHWRAACTFPRLAPAHSSNSRKPISHLILCAKVRRPGGSLSW